ncbi:MAG: cation-translocating P-type ATPase, partial [Oscillospiraceae bacterium]|nr:cation-translocating P-type ATPase [Oscillospiraceae bacterium]
KLSDNSFDKSQFSVSGEATEIALMVLGAKLGVTQKNITAKYYKYDEIPFDSDRKCMSVLAKDKSGANLVFTKGAVDVILDKCAFVLAGEKVVPISHANRMSILKKAEDMGENALRVLGFAYKDLGNLSKTNAENNLIFIGLVGMIDMPRKEAFDAVLKCKKAGIKTVMITGDHKTTATAIAKTLGIYRSGDIVLTGKELDMMSDSEFERKVRDVSVYARVNPSHKLKIVKALKKRGNIVAMTGDGVNDSPAIKEADIGAAMGINGTDVTKEAASIVLLDDNFATLVAAVSEGRVIYKNIRKFIRYLISCNIGEVMTMFLGMIMGMPVILLPIQILLVNLVTDGLPAIALGLDPADEDAMSQKPRGKDEGIFSNGLLSTIIFRGMLIGISTLGSFVTLTKYFGSLDVARTGALLTLILSQLIHVFECKSETKPIYKINLLNNKKLILAVLFSLAVAVCAVYLPQMQMIFSTVALNGSGLIIAILYSLVGVFLSGLTRKRKTKTKLYDIN